MKDNSIYKKALKLAVPMMIQSGITNAVGLVDNIMVGSLGTESITAVSIAGQLIFVFNLAIFGGLSGPGIYGAQFFGHGNTEGVKGIFRLKFWIGLLCTIAGVLVFIFAGDMLIKRYLTGEGNDIDPVITLKFSRQYLDIMLIGFLPFTITQVYAGSLRETDESVKPMVAGIASVVVDVVFNYLLIYGKLGFPRLEVRGAAIATVIARFVEMGVVVLWAHKRRDIHTFLKDVYKTLKVPAEMAGKVLKKSFPIFINEFLWAGGLAVLTQIYSKRGLDIIAGLNISNAICNLLNVVFVALGSAVGIIIGQMLGASDYKKAKDSSVRLMWFTSAICVLLTIVLVSISGVFPKIYNTTDAVRDYSTKFIIITALFFPIQGFLNTLYFTLRSGGKTVITFLFDSGFSWVFSVPVAYVICTYTGLPILWIYVTIQALDIIKVVVGYILIKKGIWITNLVGES
ncbi:MAG: MATE family efflux transporter [Lachnospiraceae bacterium]|nr:MATE family efflux transporter [Lachnospiraceae bacterium]